MGNFVYSLSFHGSILHSFTYRDAALAQYYKRQREPQEERDLV